MSHDVHHRSHRIRHLGNLNDRDGHDDNCDDNCDDSGDTGNDDEENLNQTNTFVHAVFADFVQRVPT